MLLQILLLRQVFWEIHLSRHKTLCCIITRSVELYIRFYHIQFILSFWVWLYHILSYFIVLYLIVAYHIVSYLIVLDHILSYLIVFYCILLHHVISYLIMLLYFIVPHIIVSYQSPKTSSFQDMFLSCDIMTHLSAWPSSASTYGGRPVLSFGPCWQWWGAWRRATPPSLSHPAHPAVLLLLLPPPSPHPCPCPPHPPPHPLCPPLSALSGQRHCSWFPAPAWNSRRCSGAECHCYSGSGSGFWRSRCGVQGNGSCSGGRGGWRTTESYSYSYQSSVHSRRHQRFHFLEAPVNKSESLSPKTLQSGSELVLIQR